jgi:hypothetical protein
MLYKIQLVPLVFVPSFLKIYANQFLSMIVDLCGRWSEKRNNIFKDNFHWYFANIKQVSFNMPHCAIRLQILLWSPGEVNARHVVGNFLNTSVEARGGAEAYLLLIHDLGTRWG